MFERLLQFWDNTSFYLERLVYYIGFSAAALFVLSYFIPPLFTIGTFVLITLCISTVIDFLLLYQRKGIQAERMLSDRLSNGDDNKVVLVLQNSYPFKITVNIIEELPFQLQDMNWKKQVEIEADSSFNLEYLVTPKARGEYNFGRINVFVKGPLKLVSRRYITGEEISVKVYPSYIQMRRYHLMAVSSNLQETGVKRLRKLGHSMEFEQIKEYVRGDDYRTLNWKASARKGDLMVNQFTDERSQQIYCIINKGRVMKMPFEGMTLMDYAINASLVLSSVALQKHDKAGLICFSQKIDSFLAADKKPTQINTILEALYKQQTDFMEPDFEHLFSIVRNRITHRSLLVLFTNFESVESLQRDLPSLKRLAHYHLLMVIFFDNTELKQLIETNVSSTEDIYIKTIAEKYRHEKVLIAKELQKFGILSVLSTPQDLSINTLNKYLEVKNRQAL
jgi:uncharacterized protein (DUF58 family)